MRIDRDVLMRHLDRISCRGQINQAVFTDAFQTHAITPDFLLLVLAPGLPGVEALAQEIGVADLSRLRTAAGAFRVVDAGTPDAPVDDALTVTFADNYLTVQYARGPVGRIVTAAPRTIATKIKPETVATLLGEIGAQIVPLTPLLVRDICDAFAGWRAEQVEMRVGPTGGMLRVGTEHSDVVELPVEILTAPTPFTLVFGEALIAALSSVTSADAVLHLNGPGKAVVIRDGGYTYFVSPRPPVVQEEPRQQKQRGKKAAAAAAA